MAVWSDVVRHFIAFSIREKILSPVENPDHTGPHFENPCAATDYRCGQKRRKGAVIVKDIIYPLDGNPCEKDCPDRYIDHPGGGCFLTTAQGMGAKLIDLGGGDVGMMFTPNGKKVKT